MKWSAAAGLTMAWLSGVRGANAQEPPAAVAPVQGAAVPTPAPAQDCVAGLLVWCFAQEARGTTPRTKLRLEVYGGYKPGNSYYGDEIRSCTAAGCTLRFDGPSAGVDAFYNILGNPHGDDYVDLGLSASYMPILRSMENNGAGFQGSLGPVAPGDGSLAYVPLRITLRRPNFLYVLRSKYLISAFGVGLAFPVASGAGGTFTGGDGPKVTLGGRLGVQLPLTDVWKVGVATNWNVVWYGASFEQASFQASYGVNLAYQL
jgi:hypothetical protein